MNLKDIGINTMNWVDSAQDRIMESPCECGIEPPDFINHGVSSGLPGYALVLIYIIQEKQ